jgi:ribosomal protein L19
MKTIEEINQHNVKKILAEKKIPEFFPGDVVKVGVRITEGKKDRIQYFEGVCIAKKIEILIHLSQLEKFHLEKVLKEHFHYMAQ